MYLTIDIGATNTRVAAADSLEPTSLEHVAAFPTSPNPESGVQDLIQEIQDFRVAPQAIGIGIAGRVDERKSLMIASTNLPSWSGYPIVATLNTALGCPILLENDGVVAALGEAYGGLVDHQDFLYLTWGSGIGGGLVEWSGTRAHVTKVKRKDILAPAEERFGGISLQKRFSKPASQLTADEWDTVMAEVGVMIRDISALLNQSIVVIGGGITMKQQKRIKEIAPTLTGIELQIARHGEDSGLYGGLALLRSLTQSQTPDTIRGTHFTL